MSTQDFLDLHHELKATKTVGGSMLTFVNSVHQRLKSALDANNGHGDIASLRALCDDLGPANRDGLAAAIRHNTVAAADERDIDPDAPPKASNVGSTGTNVYGSKGPEDTDTQRNSSLGYAGRDSAERGGEASGPAHGHQVYDPGQPKPDTPQVAGTAQPQSANSDMSPEPRSATMVGGEHAPQTANQLG